MKTFKRSFSLLISLILIFSLCACSDIDPNYGVSESSNTSSTAEPDTDETEDAKIISSDRVMSTFFDISLFDEENYSEIYLGKKCEIDGVYGGKNLPVPATLEDLAKIGWVLAEGNEYNENSLVFSYETIDVVFHNESGLKVKAQCYNSSRSSVKLSECYVV